MRDISLLQVVSANELDVEKATTILAEMAAEERKAAAAAPSFPTEEVAAAVASGAPKDATEGQHRPIHASAPEDGIAMLMDMLEVPRAVAEAGQRMA